MPEAHGPGIAPAIAPPKTARAEKRARRRARRSRGTARPNGERLGAPLSAAAGEATAATGAPRHRGGTPPGAKERASVSMNAAVTQAADAALGGAASQPAACTPAARTARTGEAASSSNCGECGRRWAPSALVARNLAQANSHCYAMREVYSGRQGSIKSKKAVCRRDSQRKQWLRTGVRHIFG